MEEMPIKKAVSLPEGPSPAAGTGSRQVDREKLKKVCADFEALLLARLLKIMRQSVPSSGLLGGGPGKEIYEGFLDQELSKKMAERGGIGLGAKLYQQVLRTEEKGGGGQAPPAAGKGDEEGK